MQRFVGTVLVDYKFLKISYLFLAVLGLVDMYKLSLIVVNRATCSCDAGVSQCCGFSRVEYAPRNTGSVVVAHGFN